MNTNKLRLTEHKAEALVFGPSRRREGVPVDTHAVGDGRTQVQ